MLITDHELRKLLLSTSQVTAADAAFHAAAAEFAAAFEESRAEEKLRQLALIALFAIAEQLNRAFTAWTSCTCICFGVCELSIRCGYAEFRQALADKD